MVEAGRSEVGTPIVAASCDEIKLSCPAATRTVETTAKATSRIANLQSEQLQTTSLSGAHCRESRGSVNDFRRPLRHDDPQIIECLATVVTRMDHVAVL